MTILSTTQQFDETYAFFKDYFMDDETPSFHNLLWQIIVNQVGAKDTICLYPVEAIRPGVSFQLTYVSPTSAKHQPTNVHLRIEDNDLSIAIQTCAHLNEQLFGLTYDGFMHIVGRSMELAQPEEFLKLKKG